MDAHGRRCERARGPARERRAGLCRAVLANHRHGSCANANRHSNAHAQSVANTDAYAYAYNLKPELQEKIKQCFFAYRAPAEMAKGLGGDRFLPISYQKDWELVRTVAEAAGEKFTRDAYNQSARK